MTKIKVEDLARAELDFHVGRAQGLNCAVESYMTMPPRPIACWRLKENGKPDFAAGPYLPSTIPEHGKPIIESEGIRLEKARNGWAAISRNGHKYVAPHPLMAAMRAYVASVYGPEVPPARTVGEPDPQ